jgi:hypothetical protein
MSRKAKSKKMSPAWFGFALVRATETIFIVSVGDEADHHQALARARRSAEKDGVEYDSIACFDLMQPPHLVGEAMCRWLVDEGGMSRGEAEHQVRGIAERIKKDFLGG